MEGPFLEFLWLSCNRGVRAGQWESGKKANPKSEAFLWQPSPGRTRFPAHPAPLRERRLGGWGARRLFRLWGHLAAAGVSFRPAQSFRLGK